MKKKYKERKKQANESAELTRWCECVGVWETKQKKKPNTEWEERWEDKANGKVRQTYDESKMK